MPARAAMSGQVVSVPAAKAGDSFVTLILKVREGLLPWPSNITFVEVFWKGVFWKPPSGTKKLSIIGWVAPELL